MKTTTQFPLDERRYDQFIAVAELYSRWLRFRVSGLEHVPAEGPALLIGNHTGLRLHDGLATAVALRNRHPARRIVRTLAHTGIAALPRVANTQTNYMGAVIGTRPNTLALLDEGWLVMTYPEGAKSTAKPFGERDRVMPIEAWGRGWADLAAQTGVPVIPIGVSGVEAAIPTLWRSTFLGRRFGMKDDLYPVSPQAALIGFQPFLTPLLPFPVRCGLSFGPPILPSDHGNDTEKICAATHHAVAQAIDRARHRSRGVYS
ncbi:1-acyl-sn-glycerol-3-phosphate acyltransferase [Nocardia sp. 004]|uniref:1-acyl-sn-glycerol-3-phosphate acyltransferase n=1 Tax=Nocardia sp. 004 TaxID=3385978 RepID=UPI0039A39AB7